MLFDTKHFFPSNILSRLKKKTLLRCEKCTKWNICLSWMSHCWSMSKTVWRMWMFSVSCDRVSIYYLIFFPVCCLYHRRPAAGTSCCFIPWGDLWPTGAMCFHQILGHLYIKTNLANSSSVLFKHVMRVLYFPFWFPSWWPEMTTLSLSVLPVKYKFFIDPTLVVTCKIKMPESTDLPYGFGIFLHTSEKRKVPNTIRVCILC